MSRTLDAGLVRGRALDERVGRGHGAHDVADALAGRHAASTRVPPLERLLAERLGVGGSSPRRRYTKKPLRAAWPRPACRRRAGTTRLLGRAPPRPSGAGSGGRRGAPGAARGRGRGRSRRRRRRRGARAAADAGGRWPARQPRGAPARRGAAGAAAATGLRPHALPREVRRRPRRALAVSSRGGSSGAWATRAMVSVRCPSLARPRAARAPRARTRPRRGQRQSLDDHGCPGSPGRRACVARTSRGPPALGLEELERQGLVRDAVHRGRGGGRPHLERVAPLGDAEVVTARAGCGAAAGAGCRGGRRRQTRAARATRRRTGSLRIRG